MGSRIRIARLQQNLSESDVAQGLCSVEALRRLEEGRGFATVDLIGKLAERLGVAAEDLLEVSETFPSVTPVPMEIGQAYFVRETYRRILEGVELQERDPALGLEARRKLVLVKTEALLRMERTKEALRVLVEAIGAAFGKKTPEDKLYLAKLHVRLGEVYELKADTERLPRPEKPGRNEPSSVTAFLPGSGSSPREEAQVEAYLAYMRGYLLVDKLPHHEAPGLADQLADGLSHVADAMGGAQSMADKLFNMANEVSERDPRLAFNYLTQSKALYRSLNRRQMQTEIVEAMQEVRRKQANPEATLRDVLREVRKGSFGDDDRIRLINSYSNAAEHCFSQQRYEETGVYLQQARSLITVDVLPMFVTRTYYTTQARYMALRGEYEGSIEHAMTAFEKAHEMGFSEEAVSALKLAADAYKKLGEAAKAVDVLRRASDLLAGVESAATQYIHE
nr:helix-turn-helix transcriptional regulator [Tumebacillus amylolyticus]